MKQSGPAAQPTERPEPTVADKTEKPSRAALSRHKRKCTICQHPQRDQIEQEFLQWCSPRTLAECYQLTERAVYRHAHARGLFQRRGNNLRFSLGQIIERAERMPMTPNAILEAIRLFAHISPDGHWVNPPRHVIIQHVGEQAPDPPRVQTPSRKRATRSSKSKSSRSNRQSLSSNFPCNSLKTTDRMSL